jgi:hypothetical protein
MASLVVAIALPMLACVPAEEINPATTAFITASDKMTTSLRTGQVANFRRNLRQDVFVADVKVFVRQRSLATMVDAKQKVPVDWLCAPIYRYSVVATPLAAVDARNQILIPRTKSPSDDLWELISALGASYAIPAEKESDLERSYDAWLAGKGKSCSDTVAQGDPYVTRPLTTTEAFIPAALAAISLAETFWAIGKPVAVGALKNIDTERRAAAIKTYFSDDKNVAVMKSQFDALDRFLTKEIELERTKAAGTAAATALILYDPRGAHWTKINQVLSSGDCDGNDSDLGRRKVCMDALLAAANKPLADALDAADKFDAALTKEMPAEKGRLGAQVTTLQKIARGEQVSDDHMKAVFSAAMRYIALFQSVGDATSDANRKKIIDAWTAFEKALKT